MVCLAPFREHHPRPQYLQKKKRYSPLVPGRSPLRQVGPPRAFDSKVEGHRGAKIVENLGTFLKNALS